VSKQRLAYGFNLILKYCLLSDHAEWQGEESTKMKVLIVDDHVAVRNAVRSSIEDCPEVDIVGEVANGEDALIRTEQLHPELIIMDINMSVLDGLSAAEIIKKYYPETRILIFSMHKVQEFIETAKKLGLSGYVPKEENGPSLRDAIDAVVQGQRYFPSVDFNKASST
jgi:DNA-binding NarL/FixJ family response regulator